MWATFFCCRNCIFFYAAYVPLVNPQSVIIRSGTLYLVTRQLSGWCHFPLNLVIILITSFLSIKSPHSWEIWVSSRSVSSWNIKPRSCILFSLSSMSIWPLMALFSTIIAFCAFFHQRAIRSSHIYHNLLLNHPVPKIPIIPRSSTVQHNPKLCHCRNGLHNTMVPFSLIEKIQVIFFLLRLQFLYHQSLQFFLIKLSLLCHYSVLN